jgi:segregation and condensation protein A
MRMLDLNIAGEFLVMAATLMMIKSRMLLPVEERRENEEDEEEEDPRWYLVRQLVEYKKFKDVALFLEELHGERVNVFAREGEAVNLGDPGPVDLQDVSLFDLISAFQEALSRAREESLPEIFADQFTVADKVDDLVALLEQTPSVSIRALFRGMRTRSEMICTFLALLELIKLKQVQARQAGAFGDIELTRHPEWNPTDAFLESAGGGGSDA